MLEFQERYGSEAGCIEPLARLHWPQGYVCARCGHQESVTAGTIFHRTRTAVAQMVSGGVVDGARQARGLGPVAVARTAKNFDEINHIC